MNKGQAGWLVLFILALVLIIIGFNGDLGTLTAILLCPAYVDIQE